MMISTEQLLEAWVAVWNSYDLNQVDRLFLKDDRLTYFSSEKEGLIRGIEAVREHHRKFGFVEGGKVSENKLWLKDLQVSDFGPVAVAAAIWIFRRASGQEQRGPVTFVCVKEEGEYRLVHLHFSNYPGR
jgi:ketosteroid isomerase-like protein